MYTWVNGKTSRWKGLRSRVLTGTKDAASFFFCLPHSSAGWSSWKIKRWTNERNLRCNGHFALSQRSCIVSGERQCKTKVMPCFLQCKTKSYVRNNSHKLAWLTSMKYCRFNLTSLIENVFFIKRVLLAYSEAKKKTVWSHRYSAKLPHLQSW